MTKTKVSFLVPGTRKYFFVVDKNGEEEDVSVSIQLRVKS